jgi:hypothetical protein
MDISIHSPNHVSSKKHVRNGLAALSLLIGMESAARAEMLVLKSNVPTVIAVGACLHDDGMPKLPENAEVIVLMLPARESKVFKGKASGSSDTIIGGTREVEIGSPPSCD